MAQQLAEAFIPDASMLLKLTLAILAGAIVGIDRELRLRSAGLRTHMLTSLAAALFTLVTLALFQQIQQLGVSSNADPLRVVEAVTLGVSFLAAGAIIHHAGKVHGVTTGATIWLAGALGIAAGAGLYSTLVTGVLFGALVIIGMRLIEKYLLHTK